MEKMKIRLLHPNEIDVRVGAIYEKGITLLLYKDARVDMNILDETFGAMNWKRRHIMFGDNMFCEVLIKDEESGRWVSKMDIGSPSFSEPQKGAASDAFKRACVSWGIGRELYTAPFIWIPIDKVKTKEEKGKKVVKDKFIVQSISYNEEKRSIDGLVIVNQDKAVVYQFVSLKHVQGEKITQQQSAELLEELKRTGITVSGVLKKYELNKLTDMDTKLWNKAMSALKEVETKAA